MGRNYASLTLSYSWEGFMQNMPPVTLGEELCNTCFALFLHNIQSVHYRHGKDLCKSRKE